MKYFNNNADVYIRIKSINSKSIDIKSFCWMFDNNDEFNTLLMYRVEVDNISEMIISYKELAKEAKTECNKPIYYFSDLRKYQ